MRTPQRSTVGQLFAGMLTLFLTAGTGFTQDVRVLGERHGVTLPEWMQRELARDPNAFEFERGWKSRLLGAKVQRLARRGMGLRPDTLAPEEAARVGTAVAGTLLVPVLPFLFADTDSVPYDASVLEARLFSESGSRLSLKTYYRELSRGVFSLDGDVHEWTAVPGAGADYVVESGEPPYLGRLLHDVLERVDPGIDFGRYDRDGDGYVDVVAFVHPEIGAECRGDPSKIWSHRWRYGQALNSPDSVYLTDDGVKISDYIIQPALSCEGRPIEFGVFAHELGHALGLPDLYSTAKPPANAGIGEWGLMGSGQWNRPHSPSHMSAWSKVELGWMPVSEVARDSAGISLAPAAMGGSALRIDLPIAPSEYFLLGNRQHAGSDRYLHGAGLLIWHVDSAVIANRRATETVQNTTARKGLDLEEADGQADLDHPSGRADAGDPFPGITGAMRFDAFSEPSSRSNMGEPSGVTITNIRQSGSNVVLDVAFSREILARAEEIRRRGIGTAPAGPLAVVSFEDEVRLEDWQWLEAEGFQIRNVQIETSSVVVRVPPEYEEDPRAANARIKTFSTQQR